VELDAGVSRGAFVHYFPTRKTRCCPRPRPCAGPALRPPRRVKRRGEVRTDEPAGALGVIVLHAALFSTQRGTTIGRPEGSCPLGRLALEITLRGMRPDDGPRQEAAGQATARPRPVSPAGSALAS
jgi:hypothetical protein